MAARTMEYQQQKRQKEARTLVVLLQGVHLAIGASGAAQVKNIGAVQRAFAGLVNDLLEMDEPSPVTRKVSLARLQFQYGSAWREHLDELRDEDKEKVEKAGGV